MGAATHYRRVVETIEQARADLKQTAQGPCEWAEHVVRVTRLRGELQAAKAEIFKALDELPSDVMVISSNEGENELMYRIEAASSSL